MPSRSDGEGGCCLDCHFRWEERRLFPHLRPPVAARLEAEHHRIAAMSPDLQSLAVPIHARMEERVLLALIPAELYRELLRQHQELG